MKLVRKEAYLRSGDRAIVSNGKCNCDDGVVEPTAESHELSVPQGRRYGTCHGSRAAPGPIG